MTTTPRVENPHREEPRTPLLTPHPLRPATLASGVALTGLGVVFGFHQHGQIGMGSASTIATLLIAAAVVLAGIAVGWSRTSRPVREGDPDAQPDG